MDQARLHQLAGQLNRAGLTQEQIVLKIGALSSNPCATCAHCRVGIKDTRAASNAFGAQSVPLIHALNLVAYCSLFPKVQAQANGTIQAEMRETAERCPLYNVTDVGAALLALSERITKLEQALNAVSKQTIRPVTVTASEANVIDVEAVVKKPEEPPKLKND